MGRQKKQLHYNVTRMECRGDKRGLGSHRRQIKGQRNSSVAVGSPLRSVGSKPQAGLPSLQHQSPKRNQITSSCEKQLGFSLPWTESWSYREPFKEPTHKFHLQSLILGSSKGRGQSGLGMLEESLGTVALGRELREQLPGSQC